MTIHIFNSSGYDSDSSKFPTVELPYSHNLSPDPGFHVKLTVPDRGEPESGTGLTSRG